MLTGTGYSDDSRDAAKEAAKKALLSGGLFGAIFGAGEHAFRGSSPITKAGLLKAALMGGATMGGITGGGAYLGTKLMGTPDDSDSAAYTKRAGLGAGIAGGLGGALLGAAASRVKLPMVPSILKEYLAALKAKPLGEALLKGAGVGAAVGAIPAAYYGADEGMMLDTLNNEQKRRKKEQMMEQIYGSPE